MKDIDVEDCKRRPGRVGSLRSSPFQAKGLRSMMKRLLGNTAPGYRLGPLARNNEHLVTPFVEVGRPISSYLFRACRQTIHTGLKGNEQHFPSCLSLLWSCESHKGRGAGMMPTVLPRLQKGGRGSGRRYVTFSARVKPPGGVNLGQDVQSNGMHRARETTYTFVLESRGMKGMKAAVVRKSTSP